MRNSIVPPENIIAKEIPGFPGYWATDDGRIWSGRSAAYRALSKNTNGYLTVTLAGGVSRKVHRLVALAWHGASNLPMVRHLDGNQTNNRPENLAYGTNADNLADEARLGNLADGTLCHSAAATSAQARLIVELHAAGVAVRATARIAQTSYSVARRIIDGTAWFRLRRCPFNLPPKLLKRWHQI